MNQPRLPPNPDLLRDFYDAAFTRLGAITDRPWHDRLKVLADGPAATVWDGAGSLVETELVFPPPEVTLQRDAAREVFPGCPLTFRLTEVVFQNLPKLFRQPIGDAQPKAPERTVAEKLLRQQKMLSPMTRITFGDFHLAWHFSVVATVRAEVVAIDQSWHALRIAFDLSSGEADPHLERELAYLASGGESPHASPPWPALDEKKVAGSLRANLLRNMEEPLATIRARQERHLGRELARVDQYFAGYRSELATRLKRQRTDESRRRFEERIQATETEKIRRREDQIQRHEIRLIPHVDALMLTAERGWQATVTLPDRRPATGTFLPRARHWFGLL